MDQDSNRELEQVVMARLMAGREAIEYSLRQISWGNPLGAEQSIRRGVARLQAKAGLSAEEAALAVRAVQDFAHQASRVEPRPETLAAEPPELTIRVGKPTGPEAVWGTLDFVPVSFFVRGRRAADAVARVAYRSGRAQGSGFLVAPGLFLTNQHVIKDPAHAETLELQFDYEHDDVGGSRKFCRYALDPARCFAFDDVRRLDYCLIAVGPRIDGDRDIGAFGYKALSDAADKHMLGEVANIIQHPAGRMKEIVLRENRLVNREDTTQVLHYVADTEPGSSGSPVFNNQWEPIALHHWGGPHLEVQTPDGRLLTREINEGIRVSAIVNDLQTRWAGRSPAVAEALALWRAAPRAYEEDESLAGERAADVLQPSVRTRPDGTTSWIFPIEISVRAPLIPASTPVAPAAPAAPAVLAGLAERLPGRRPPPAWSVENFADRGGFEPGFLPGFIVPLPAIRPAAGRIAPNLEAGRGDDPHELKYHHFSIKMNADRRLAFFTACNIDGSRLWHVDRENKDATENPTAKQLGVENLEAAEASDDFRPDRRIDIENQMTKPFYEGQKVPGFPKGNDPDRIARMLQKGHIVLRSDPAWGTREEALAAERDTFFYTNAGPQIGFFNQGSAFDKPGTKGRLRWRAVESYVLRNALVEKQRVSVFAGPVFRADDPDYRFGSKVPMTYWKIAVWVENQQLRAIALLADQYKLVEALPENLSPEAEEFTDPHELARVSEFLTTVSAIEQMTHLDFGVEVRSADVRAGSDVRPAEEFDPNALTPRRQPKVPPGRRRKKKN
ncbi:DNA/RNA non-specific endonuclease [Phreatobacter cathodiphilus]|uniref:Serine protease n=1 Tax=Phreatobacter cathodiphilus TaxID=1868589 RepID=A0A2S0N8E2_9HYPH|nr:DNA/RNA non-specific endonuclease [Phreatobacter cathodiphilus]AVO44429.1 hypothetical protein C6569_04765 [Phreatobacter cathodiphilus]